MFKFIMIIVFALMAVDLAKVNEMNRNISLRTFANSAGCISGRLHSYVGLQARQPNRLCVLEINESRTMKSPSNNLVSKEAYSI